MEIFPSPKPQEKTHQIPTNNAISTPPLTPNNSSNNSHPYPTTFVQADTSSFKQVVQMLTGSNSSSSSSSSSRSDPPRINNNIPISKTTPQKKPGFKLYERRNTLKNSLLMIDTLNNNPCSRIFSPRNKHHEILSPSILDFPALALSPATPLNHEDKFLAPSPMAEEEKAIAEKKFYFHPSPRMNGSTRDAAVPELLPLFPVTSPRVSGSES